MTTYQVTVKMLKGGALSLALPGATTFAAIAKQIEDDKDMKIA
jgi:hypothetical protein